MHFGSIVQKCLATDLQCEVASGAGSTLRLPPASTYIHMYTYMYICLWPPVSGPEITNLLCISQRTSAYKYIETKNKQKEEKKKIYCHQLTTTGTTVSNKICIYRYRHKHTPYVCRFTSRLTHVNYRMLLMWMGCNFLH